MELTIDRFKVLFYNFKVKVKNFKYKKVTWCSLGFHKMRRGFGYGGEKRMDICLKCNFKVWYKDNTYKN